MVLLGKVLQEGERLYLEFGCITRGLKIECKISSVMASLIDDNADDDKMGSAVGCIGLSESLGERVRCINRYIDFGRMVDIRFCMLFGKENIFGNCEGILNI